MTDKEKALIVIEKLKEAYPDAKCSLKYDTPIQFLIAIRLSAQCTDNRVNLVTPALFSRFKKTEDFANANSEEVAKYVHSCGFYRTKSSDIVNMCKIIIDKFGGKIPDNMEELTSLPGIGRKTANLFLGEVYDKPGIVVDTHFIRITARLGFHNIKDAEKIEKIMEKLIPKEEMLSFCHRIVAHGRAVCTAKSPMCSDCCLKLECNQLLI